MASKQLSADIDKESSITDTTVEEATTTKLPFEAGEQSSPQVQDASNGKETAIAAKEMGGEAQAQQEEAEENMEYPHGAKLSLILTAMCLATFLVALDQTIIATAIPKITDHFDSIKDIGWVGSPCLFCYPLSRRNNSSANKANLGIVWKRLSSHRNRVPTNLWEDIHSFQCRNSKPNKHKRG